MTGKVNDAALEALVAGSRPPRTWDVVCADGGTLLSDHYWHTMTGHQGPGRPSSTECPALPPAQFTRMRSFSTALTKLGDGLISD